MISIYMFEEFRLEKFDNDRIDKWLIQNGVRQIAKSVNLVF